MAILPKDKVDEIYSKLDIVDVIGNYLSLEKKGRNYVAVCPFHADTNPSLSISPEKQIYRCFVCGNSGNAIGFMKNYLHVDYGQALNEAAKLVGVDVTGYQNNYVKKIDPRLEKLMSINEEASKIFNYYLNTAEGSNALAYLKNRKIDEHLIKKFDIGYAPKGNILLGALQKLNYTTVEIAQAGIAGEVDSRYFDRFIDRVMFPIHNEDGRIIGYSGRIYRKSQSEAKYVNTSETDIFKKNEVLYNYHRIKGQIKKGDTVIICEGFMDVIALEKADIVNAVALMGTALTNKHLNLLNKLTRNIILCLDGDNAGQKATANYLDILIKNGFNCSIVNLPDKMDPDEVFNQQGKEALVSLINNPINQLDFKIKYNYLIHDMNNYENKKEYIYQIMNEIVGLKDILDQNYYLNKLSQVTDMDITVLQDIFNDLKNSLQAKKVEYVRQQPKNNPNKPFESKFIKAQRELLYYMMVDLEVAKRYEKEVGFMMDRTYNVIASYILDYYRNHQEVKLHQLLDEFNQGNDSQKEELTMKIQSEIIKISELNLPTTPNPNAIRDYINTIKNYTIESRYQELVKAFNLAHDSVQKSRLLQELVDLKRGK